jgi:hypothetical protein
VLESTMTPGRPIPPHRHCGNWNLFQEMFGRARFLMGERPMAAKTIA